MALITEEPTSGIRSFVGRRMSSKVTFMGEPLTIFKLNVSEVMDIQEKAKASVIEEDDAESAAIAQDDELVVLRTIIRAGVEGGNTLTDADFLTFPLDELSKLSNAIMKFSGIGDTKAKGNEASPKKS